MVYIETAKEFLFSMVNHTPMLLIIGNQLYDCRSVTAQPISSPVLHPLAIQTNGQSAALVDREGRVWRYGVIPNQWTKGETLSFRSFPRLGSISADGDLVMVGYAMHELVKVEGFYKGQAINISTPDFICAIPDVFCHSTDQTWGYTFLTEQPHGDWGSYGSPEYGVFIFDKTGTVLRSDGDTRSSYDDWLVYAVWGSNVDPLAMMYRENSGRESLDIVLTWSEIDPSSTDVLAGIETPSYDFTVEFNTISSHVHHPHMDVQGNAFVYVNDKGNGYLVLRNPQQYELSGDQPMAFCFGESMVACSLHFFPKILWVDIQLRVFCVHVSSLPMKEKE